MSPISTRQNQIEAIKTSPLFQLSLGSKELFHSNFMAWLAGKYPTLVGQLFAPYLKDKTGDLTIIKVEREQKNIDIYLYFANGQELIIENKVKSIPYIEQLKEYSHNHKDHQNFLLLTLTRPEFTKTDKIPVHDIFWHTMSYQTLALALNKLAPDIKDPYDKFIISDYVFFITFISSALEKVEVSESDYFTFYKPDTDQTLSLLKDLRMADVYLKIKYQSLGSLVHQQLIKSIPNAQIHFGTFPKEPKKGTLYISYGMQRAQGIAQICYKIEEGLYASIQLQERRYSKLLQGYAGYGRDTKDYAEKLLSLGKWFTFDHITKHPKVYPTQNHKNFNQYGVTDFYQSVNLDETYTIAKIIEIMIQDTKQMIDLTK
ncbi:PD-(D/E)XK nuclease family protein [Candidatus Kaiserbacteria bacterium]|nr:PD-(D/E)XK nuclease family protein [Candidatus Kaiserbacteria bacterium]